MIEVCLFLLYFSFGISWLAYSPLLPELERFHQVTHAQAASVISSVSLAKAFVPLFAGLLASRFGLGRTLLLGAALSSLSMLAPWSPNFKVLLIVRFLFGIGGAMIVTLMGAMVMQLFPKERLPLMNGINNVAVNAGVTAALFSTLQVTGVAGWQWGLTIFGALSGVLTIVWWLIAPTNQAESSSSTGSAEEKTSLLEVLKMPETWYMALAFTGPLSLYLALNTWLPSHYVQAFGLTREAASGLTGVFNLVGIPTAVMGGMLTSKLGLRRPLVIGAGLLMTPAALGMVLSPVAGLRFASAVLLGVAFFLYVSPLFTIPMELPGSSAGKVALINGVVFSVAYLVSFASPLIVGKLAEATGTYGTGLTLFGVVAASLAVGGALLPETGPGFRRGQ